jgi:soluble lytic murein transglycosylase-like protein
MLAAVSSVAITFGAVTMIILSQLPEDNPTPPNQGQDATLVTTPDITTNYTAPTRTIYLAEQQLAEDSPLAVYYPAPAPEPEPILCDGIGHCWKWDAWRNADDSAWIPPAPEPSIDYVPAPTYSAPAYSYASGVEQWRGLVSEIFPSYIVDYVLAIMQCESGGDPNETGSQGEMGLLQIHPQFHPDATYDPYGNIVAAYRISNGGTDFSAWTCA